MKPKYFNFVLLACGVVCLVACFVPIFKGSTFTIWSVRERSLLDSLLFIGGSAFATALTLLAIVKPPMRKSQVQVVLMCFVIVAVKLVRAMWDDFGDLAVMGFAFLGAAVLGTIVAAISSFKLERS